MPRRDSSVRIDIVHLVARNFPRESSLLDEEKLHDRSLRGDIIFQNTSKRGTKNYERVEVEKVG